MILLNALDTDSALRKKKVLIIDEDASVNNMICETLSSSGFETVSAYSWLSARNIITKKRPDVIIMDFNLSDKRLLEKYRQIARHELTKDTPIILVSRNSGEDLKISCFLSGVKQFANRRASLHNLVEHISNTLDSSAHIPTMGEVLGH